MTLPNKLANDLDIQAHPATATEEVAPASTETMPEEADHLDVSFGDPKLMAMVQDYCATQEKEDLFDPE